MSDIVSPLLQWLNANPQWAGLVVFAISAGESAPIFGTIVPGSITMTAFGALAGAGVIPLWSTLLWAIFGAIVGDGIGYWIGYYFKDKLHQVWPFKNNPEILAKGEVFFTKYGGMSVFIGRFVGPVRALVPIVAGMLGMKPLQFTLANVTSAIGWAPAYMLPGILLGAFSLELPPEIAVHVLMVLFIIFLFFILCIWILFKLFHLIQNQVNQLENWLWQGLKKRSYCTPITFLLKHHDKSRTHGQMNLALFFLMTSALLLILICYIHLVGASHVLMNDVMYHFFRGIRTNPIIDNFMLNLTLLGEKQVILFAFTILFAWLLFCKRWRAALHILALSVLAVGSVFVIKHLVQNPRPWGILQNQDPFSLPSGHTTLATVFFLGLAYFISQSIPRLRSFIFSIAILLAFMVGMSRVYLGAHWFTDVLAAWLLGITILTMIVISYQRQPEKQISVLGLLSVSIVSLAMMFTVFHYQHFQQLQTNYKQISWPITETSLQHWWDNKSQLPAYRTSLFGFPSQRINLEWVGNIEEIREVLIAQGWTKPPARDLISTIHRVADISSTQYLPLISPQYLDKKPELILTRQENKKTMLVIRLWDSNLNIANAKNANLWVGIVDFVPRSYSWLFKRRSMSFSITPAVIFPLHHKAHDWQWKTTTTEHEERQQTILFIRKKG